MGLVVFLVIGIALFFFLSDQLRHSQEIATQQQAEFVTDAILRYELTPADLQAPITGARAVQLQSFMRARILRYPTVRVKIWRPDGTIIFSDNERLVGQQFDNDEVQTAARGTPNSEIEDLSAPENVYERNLASKLFSSYVPLQLGATPTEPQANAVVEIYQDYASIQSAIDQVSHTLLWTLLLGLSTLYVLMLPLAHRAARKLAVQNQQLRLREARFRSLVQNSAEVITVVDSEGVVRYQSPSVQAIFGYEPSSALGEPLLGLIHADDLKHVQSLLATGQADPGHTVDFECRWRHRDGSWRHGESSITNLVHDPAVGGLVINTRDVTQRKAMEAELVRQAFHDSLTDLANRALLTDRAEHALARAARNHSGVSIIFLDLDDFKLVNDSLGHARGDELLQSVGKRLRKLLRPTDTIARMGGDEFAMLLEDSSLEDAIHVAERVISSLDTPFMLAGREVFAHASLGLCVADSATETAETLLRNADAAMYSAKTSPARGYAVFQPEMHSAMMQRLELRAWLEHAIERDELVVHYQPVVAVDSGRWVGVEALLRWAHPSKGLVPPTDFIPLAEETGLIVPIGRWILERACRDARSWQQCYGMHSGFTVSVNVSLRQLQEQTFVNDVARVLQATGLDPGSLVLEITESQMMQDAEAVAAQLTKLKRLGVDLALDDFGTGYSSLSYLGSLPLDIIKIDRSFIASMTVDAERSPLVEAIIGVGASLGLKTTAEGVETAAQQAQLRKLGCATAQGFYFARPMNAVDLERRLAERKPAQRRGGERRAKEGRSRRAPRSLATSTMPPIELREVLEIPARREAP